MIDPANVRAALNDLDAALAVLPDDDDGSAVLAWAESVGFETPAFRALTRGLDELLPPRAQTAAMLGVITGLRIARASDPADLAPTLDAP